MCEQNFPFKKTQFFFLTQEILSGMLHMVQAPYITAQYDQYQLLLTKEECITVSPKNHYLPLHSNRCQVHS